MLDFLQNLIPVSFPIWLLFFIIPAILSFTGQFFLCLHTSKTFFRLIPLYVILVLLLIVFLYRFTGFLAWLIGGFMALILLGTAGFILAASMLGWFTFCILCKLR